jgi:hypothetical protein
VKLVGELTLSSQNPDGRDLLIDLDIDEKTLLKWIVNKYTRYGDVDWTELAQKQLQSLALLNTVVK